LIVLDTSFLYALLDAREPKHKLAAAWYVGLQEALATTPLVLAEADYFARRAGPVARRQLLADAGAGAYAIEWWPAAARQAVEIVERYADLGLSMADASLVALAARLETVSLATFDEKHFRAVPPLKGGTAFALLPADAVSV
jgi:predicted nucleic acid-binding protein